MKTRNQIAFLALIVVNAWMILSVGVATSREKFLWGMSDIGPPHWIDWTLHYGISWPIAGFLLSVWGLVEAFRGKRKEETLANLFLAMVFVEMILAGLYILGIISIYFHADYRFKA